MTPMTDLTTHDLTTTVDAHLAGYTEPDRAQRLELLGSAWAPDGRLIDPPFDGTGPEGIADMVDVLLEHYPAHHFVRTTAIDSHHTFARYGWDLVDGAGTAAVSGYDFVELDDDGRLLRIVGFFGEIPETSA